MKAGTRIPGSSSGAGKPGVTMGGGEAALAALREGLAMPFADPVTVSGIPISRATARAMERGLLRERSIRPQGGKADRPPEPLRGKPSGPDGPRPALEGART